MAFFAALLLLPEGASAQVKGVCVSGCNIPAPTTTPSPTTPIPNDVRPGPSAEELERRREEAFQAYSFRGIAAYNGRDYRTAAHWFLQALRLAPHNITAQHNYRRATERLSGQQDQLEAKRAQERAESRRRAALERERRLHEERRKVMLDQGFAWGPQRPLNYVDYGNGMIGGTSWPADTYYLNLPPHLRNPSVREEILDQAKSRLVQGGVGTDLLAAKDYDFVLGVGLSSGFFTDLLLRAYWDGLTHGRYSAAVSRHYALLKGKSFNRLDCHSNGAMVCLAAIASGDAKSREVRLFGPQITPSALRLWQRLAREKGLRITIYYNDRDPVPRSSYETGSLQLLGAPRSIGHTLGVGIARALAKSAARAQMGEVIKRHAPDIKLERFSCSERSAGAFYTLGCHGFAQYMQHADKK